MTNKTHNPRKELRDAIFTHPKTKAERKSITFFEQKLELRQPTLKAVLQSQIVGDPDDPHNLDAQKNATSESMVNMIIQHAYVPSTDELVFEESDREWLLNLPFGPDLANIAKVLNEMTSLTFGEEAKNSEETQ